MPNRPINSELNAKNTCSTCDHYNGSDNTCRRSSPRPDVTHIGTDQEWRAINNRVWAVHACLCRMPFTFKGIDMYNRLCRNDLGPSENFSRT